ncbi:MAG: formate dehydrogenase accessory sulfurtransferase FdhD [Phycisphaerales bacterium JB063]
MNKPDDNPAVRAFPIERWSEGHATPANDELAVEEPLEIRVRGRAVSITMRTPGHDEDLAIGFLLSEGLIHSASDISRVDPCVRAAEGNIINVFLAPYVEVDFDKLTRHVFASSSCGVCGKASIDAVRLGFPPVPPGVTFSTATIQQMPHALRAAQSTFERTGGLHAAALFSANGKLAVLREDVGRHNAVDKALGWALQQPGIAMEQHALMVSGRASFEIVQKALAAKVPLIAAVSAPSSLAVELARDSGQTLVGFLRPGRMNLYSHAHRVV